MRTLDAIEALLDQSADPDDVLRHVVGVLVSEGACAWAGILFVENGELVLGPEAGSPQPESRTQVPVIYDGDPVAELAADGCDDRHLLERVALLISADCLVGWDTGGVPWNADG